MQSELCWRKLTFSLEDLFLLFSLRSYSINNEEKNWDTFYTWFGDSVCKTYLETLNNPIPNCNICVTMHPDRLSKIEMISRIFKNGTFRKTNIDEFPSLPEINASIGSIREEAISTLSLLAESSSVSSIKEDFDLLQRLFIDTKNTKDHDLLASSFFQPCNPEGRSGEKPSPVDESESLSHHQQQYTYNDTDSIHSGSGSLDSGNMFLETDPTFELVSSPSETPSSSQNKIWKKKIMGLLRELTNHTHGAIFLKTVKDTQAPEYSHVVKHPTSLTAIRNQIKDHTLVTTFQVHREVLLMILNALLYNEPESEIHQSALEMLAFVDGLFSQFYLNEHISFALPNSQDQKDMSSSATPVDIDTTSTKLEPTSSPSLSSVKRISSRRTEHMTEQGNSDHIKAKSEAFPVIMLRHARSGRRN